MLYCPILKSVFINKFQFVEQLIFVEKFKSVAHYTLQAKSCVLQSKNENGSKNLLPFYNVVKNPYGKRHLSVAFFMH